MPTITAWPTQKPPTRSASRGGSPGTVASTSTPAGLPHPPQAHAAGTHSAAGHLAVGAIAVASFWFPVDGAAGRRRGYSGAQRRPAGTSLATRMGRSRLGQGLAPTDGAADDLVDQPGAGRLGAGVGGEQRNEFVAVGTAALVGSHKEGPAGGPVRMGRAGLPKASLPVGLVATRQFDERPAAGLVPHRGWSAVGRQL